MMRKIIHDCDCTFGVPRCDVDDGLALLYLLGDPEAELLGVTTTYGNNTLETVYVNTKKFFRDIRREDIPVYKGGCAPEDLDNEASHYLAEMAEKYAGELELLVTGSVTNLHGAWKWNPKFFEQVKRIVLMGGITKPLIFEHGQINELNFSCDPRATYTVLTKGKDVAVITGNNCLKVLFTRKEYEHYFNHSDKEVAHFIKNETDYWFECNRAGYGLDGFYNWDVIAAAYMLHPELFEIETYDFKLSEEDLKTGKLNIVSGIEERNARFQLPVIGETQAFTKNIYQTWLNVKFGGNI